ncbi:hypothetical protein CNMCM7691_002939 [Aspergillus felis]|uniref:Uncharacterized protein n=1 Tax=Aspergillus felis TaxID=1287682 RepID=A0A8H6VCG3_9EURO|nr:hypothetical protein CNMCM7691_002939 [Aspergillus felis]
MATFGPLIRQGYTVLVLSDDVELLMDRIRIPPEYWVKRVAEFENMAMTPTTPKVWIVSVHPDASKRPGRMLKGIKTKTGTNLTFDPDTISCVAMMRRMMALNVETFKPSIRSKSKNICTVSGMFVSISWVDVYANASLMPSLCYINASKNPLKIEFSPKAGRKCDNYKIQDLSLDP